MDYVVGQALKCFEICRIGELDNKNRDGFDSEDDDIYNFNVEESAYKTYLLVSSMFDKYNLKYTYYPNLR